MGKARKVPVDNGACLVEGFGSVPLGGMKFLNEVYDSPSVLGLEPEEALVSGSKVVANHLVVLEHVLVACLGKLRCELPELCLAFGEHLLVEIYHVFVGELTLKCLQPSLVHDICGCLDLLPQWGFCLRIKLDRIYQAPRR